ncbi:DUF1405 domain-containing protein [Aliibacillus thermotolerans]|nr:DUF1405 domain-containing protein [Aliibacillus thermotolerans]
MMNVIIRFLGMPTMILLLLIINGLGTVYGYWWYNGQLEATPPIFLPFVPDSPTASLFFTFVLLLYLMKKRSGLLEAFASVTLIKYGIWAVVMNGLQGVFGDPLSWQNYMLIASHLGMAVQALLFSPYYRIKRWHLFIVAVWTLHNDVIDYVYGMHPWVSSVLTDYIAHIGYFTFWLSIVSIMLTYLFGVREKRLQINLPS